MKIVIAMDSFKGSCSARLAGEAVMRGVLRLGNGIDVVSVPMADGGEGTVDAILQGKSRMDSCIVSGPLGDRVEARYGVTENGTAVMEMSAASGITLIDRHALNPMETSSYGTGEMIRAVLDAGHRKLFVGLGGSATNDGGVGMLQALGALFLDCEGRAVGRGGKELSRIDSIDLSGFDARLRECDIVCGVDVRNPLCGPNGASSVYGPQKGATPEMVEKLDAGLKRFAGLVNKTLGIDVLNIPGSGAAGGMGAAMSAFLHARFESGIDAVIEASDLKKYLLGADLVITGEGCIDGQTGNGKVPVGVARCVKRMGPIPVIALVGRIKQGAGQVFDQGIDGVFCIADGPITLNESVERVQDLLEQTAESLARAVRSVAGR